MFLPHFQWILNVQYFKRRLDAYWQDQDIIYDFRAQLQRIGSRSEVFRLGLVIINFFLVVNFGKIND